MLQLVYILLTVFTLSAWAQTSSDDSAPRESSSKASKHSAEHRHRHHSKHKGDALRREDRERAMEPGKTNTERPNDTN
jgi:hypothetical protein